MAAAPVDEIVVVEGAYELTLRGAPTQRVDTRLVRCEAWARGPGASLRCGLAALDDDVEAAVVVLADGPDLAPAAISRVLDDWRAHHGSAVAASYGGDHGHPLVLSREAWDRVPDEGLHGVPVRLVPCDDLGFPGDVDRPEHLPIPATNSMEATSRRFMEHSTWFISTTRALVAVGQIPRSLDSLPQLYQCMSNTTNRRRQFAAIADELENSLRMRSLYADFENRCKIESQGMGAEGGDNSGGAGGNWQRGECGGGGKVFYAGE